ncbi:conserved protein of unknown function [Rhodovastum atsumiense]|uniref:Uncharacterized protein n=1 Tax=Rhodovastum atsumiense TaxID=504468 RepID=A0A5M6IZX7_9PROT|nr:hypothetical protein [Rhodovastum atsumiense]KAA5613900.1 hypothetical protein F1189_03755 [Rhodovastum atsumiense]CAH2602028.1 conserved protein of unknown function [Rhodovastum atsumiense]
MSENRFSCSSVFVEPDPYGGWRYHVHCPVVGKQFHGWRPSQQEAVAEADFWYGRIGCPLSDCTHAVAVSPG